MLLIYHIGHFALGSVCVVSVLQADACNTDTTQTQPHQISNTH